MAGGSLPLYLRSANPLPLMRWSRQASWKNAKMRTNSPKDYLFPAPQRPLCLADRQMVGRNGKIKTERR
ncbi:hypothetical protein Q31b_40580 [Novipirellula aureliae]|uniref:Uncharacterized protein n=1 Tax=Novipirellula aureliae TaxID=2527966 RepID=A0A5C6DQ76_9BACT|nr:hypothetical protein Q31b_40580 [Novipirellula aureliae]